ncbi:hypothetical protein [Corynebacterium sp. 335C]
MATANKVERYPGEEHFVEGYVPQSLNAEYSSLHRSSTWIGMGMILASLAGWGTFIFGLGVTVWGTHDSHTQGVIGRSGEIIQAGGDFNAQLFLWGGLIAALVLDIGGWLMIRKGRSEYRAYVRKYGGHH